MNDSNIQDNKVQKKCNFQRENGTYCNSFAMRDSDYCYIHNPAIPEEEKKKSLSKGGKAKILIPVEIRRKGNITLRTASDVRRFYQKLVNDVMKGELDLRIATGVSYILSGLLKAIEMTEIETKINSIENLLNEKLNNNGNE
jgi:hypothetical protein